jgi:UDP:flavonoid glycosyltransferase YjiC (YdhE family)
VKAGRQRPVFSCVERDAISVNFALNGKMKRLRRREIRARIRRQRVPTEQDWGNYQDDLDQNDAHQKFAGKTNEQVQRYFRENVIMTTDDLRWMPRIPFQYYMIGFKDFVSSRNFEPSYASDPASCFIRLVLEKLENHSDHILAIMPDLLPTVEYVANHQAEFEADKAIYGSFPEIYKQIQALYNVLRG